MRDITHFLLATLLSLATLACRHDTPPADGSLSRQLPPDTKEILRQLNDRDNRDSSDLTTPRAARPAFTASATTATTGRRPCASPTASPLFPLPTTRG